MNFKKRVNGSWHDIPHYIHTTSTDTITTLPAVLYPTGTTATVGLKGQTLQSSIPSPTSPVMPEGTGERSAQLIPYPFYSSDGEYAGVQFTTDNGRIIANGTLTSGLLYYLWRPAKFPAGTYTMSVKGKHSGATIYFRDTTHNVSVAPIYSAQEGDRSVTFTVAEEISAMVYINAGSGTLDFDCTIMLNTGEEALPFEPTNGYKIPISSANTTTPVYLGEVETTRRVKKLVLTGTENWQMNADGWFYLTSVTDDYLRSEGNITSMCSHYPTYKQSSAIAQLPEGYTGFSWGSVQRLYLKDTSHRNDLSGFKQWLAAQYAAGTPVTVWYVLATEETGIINEPLMKIGDYADEVSGITIPTTAGANTLSVGTTLQPSEITVNYKGWHPVADVHIYPDSSWMPTSWEEFRKAVRYGKAQSLYPVGTKLYENWGDETSNAWIVVDYPNDNRYIDSDLAQQGYTNRVMLMEEKLNYLRVFDAKEAWLYVETAIPVGTYRFTIPNYDSSYGGNKTYIFTSTANVPVGGQLTLTWAYNTNPTRVQGYSSSTSTSALFDVNIAEWDGTTACTDLGIIKLAMADADSAYGKLNHIHRTRYGSNNYYQSGLRQWLNSDAAANAWWNPSNIFDRPYDNRNTAGRLNTLNSAMKAVLATPTVNCITNNLFETGGIDGTPFTLQTAYTVRDKLFLVTHTETNLSSTPNVDSVLAYYTNAQNADRIKYRKDNGNAYHWWLRTPFPTLAYFVRIVYASGALNISSASNTNGSAAACIIQ